MLNGSRITKRNSTRVHCRWDNRKLPWKSRALQKATCLGNRSLRFALRKVFGLCRWSSVFGRSEKSKRYLNAASGCRENWEFLWNATGWEEATVSTVNLSFLCNRWPLSSPVSCIRTDLTCLNAYKGKKYSAMRIAPCDFELDSPLLWHVGITVIFKYLSKNWPFLISVSWFWLDIH